MKTETFTAPAHWACYFINDDASGMDDADIRAADEWIESLGFGAPVGVSEEPEFLHWHDARWAMPLACDCLTYTFFRR